ncbi:MAG TPA: hypothetical protein VK548_18715 [Candidatus Acidoferrum sp.]|nr:hypothetical protein [Candidatus Acidoferrum sp.]
MSVITRREWMKQGLKATAYVAPAVVTMAPAPVGAQVSGPLCRATLQLDPPASSSFQFFNVRWKGTGYTPNGTVQFRQPSNFFGRCRGIVVVPGTTRTADALGNFDLLLPKTILSFAVVVKGEGGNTGILSVQTVDETTGCASPIVNFQINDPGPGPDDSLTLLYVPSPVSSPLTPHVPPAPGENGSGTVIAGQCHNTTTNPTPGSGFVELRLTLSGATPNRTFTLFITVPSFAASLQGTVTTDAAGNATLARYGPNCLSNIGASSTLALTIDGNPPGASNVAYQTTLVRNDIPPC